MILIFPENMILHLRQKMKDDPDDDVRLQPSHHHQDQANRCHPLSQSTRNTVSDVGDVTNSVFWGQCGFKGLLYKLWVTWYLVSHAYGLTVWGKCTWCVFWSLAGASGNAWLLVVSK